MATDRTSSGFTAAYRQLSDKWGWFMALGIGLLIAGGIASANLFASTLVSILYIVAMMLVGGAMQFIHAFATHGWDRRLFYLLSGLLYAVAGAIAIYDPILSAVGVSLAVGFLLIGAGAFRAVSGLRDRGEKGWGWIVASGVLTLIVGIVVVASWPTVGLWLLGAMLTVDLIFQGWGFIAFALALRTRGRTHAGTSIAE